MNKLLLASVTTLSIGLAATAAPSYENDFSARTSGGISTGIWYEMPYHLGSLSLAYDANAFDVNTPYNNVYTQDTWAQARSSSSRYGFDFICATNSSGTASLPGDLNPYARFQSGVDTEDGRSVNEIQPIYNEFSTGIVRIRCDLRAKGLASSAYIRFAPVFKNNLKPGSWYDGGGRTAASFGLQDQGGALAGILLFGDGKGGGAGLSGSAVRAGRWYRFEVFFNLDKNTAWGSAWELGEDHPTPDSPASSTPLSVSFPEKHFYYDMTAETGPLAGICVMASKIASGKTLDILKAPACDNISVAWKAPGASDYELCYENDFAVRRYRTISPVPSTSGSYAAEGRTSSTFTGYNVAATVTDDGISLIRERVTGEQPVGLDDWKRMNQNGGTSAYVVKSTGDGGNILRFSGGEGAFGIAAQPLGETITSGKVRFSVDFRTPDKWHQGTRTMDLVVGAGNYYTSNTSVAGGDWVCRCSIQGNSDTTFYPASNAGSTTTKDTSTACQADNWYRAVLTLDVTAKTYDCALYDIGKVTSVSSSWQPTAQPIYSRTGQKFCADKSEVAAFSLRAYGAGTAADAKSHIYFDNVKVWKDVGTEQERLIYDNDFTRRIRYYDAPFQEKALITTDSYNVDDGQDHWIRRQFGKGEISVVGGANPCVKANSPDHYSYVVQSLGRNYKRGLVHLSADIRPPRFWTWGTARSASVIFGDDQYLQGNPNQNEQFATHRAVMFGFADASSANSGGVYTDVRLYYSNGNGNGSGTSVKLTDVTVDKTHWYRFSATADMAQMKWSLKIYDMGAAQPAKDTPDGTLVKTVENIGFYNNPVGGLSSVGLETFGVSSSFETLGTADPGPVFYDNIRACPDPTGCLIVVR